MQQSIRTTIGIFGFLTVCILCLVQITKYRIGSMLFGSDLLDLVTIALVVSFTGIGFLLHRLLMSANRKSSTQESRVLIDHKRHNISKREFEVLQHLSAGHSNAEIADLLFISESTVKTHVSKLLQKLNARRRTEAIRIARERGLI